MNQVREKIYAEIHSFFGLRSAQLQNYIINKISRAPGVANAPTMSS